MHFFFIVQSKYGKNFRVKTTTIIVKTYSLCLIGCFICEYNKTKCELSMHIIALNCKCECFGQYACIIIQVSQKRAIRTKSITTANEHRKIVKLPSLGPKCCKYIKNRKNIVLFVLRAERPTTFTPILPQMYVVGFSARIIQIIPRIIQTSQGYISLILQHFWTMQTSKFY